MAAGNGHGQGINGVIISSDSHVMEPVDLWKKGVPEKYREAAPLFPPHKVGEGFQHHAGGWDPHAQNQGNGNRRAQRRSALSRP